MDMGDSAALAAQATMAASPEVFQQLGLITRQLHDALNRLGVMPKLQQAVDGLPDARSRLSYIATKSGEAVERVLTSVVMPRPSRVVSRKRHDGSLRR